VRRLTCQRYRCLRKRGRLNRRRGYDGHSSRLFFVAKPIYPSTTSCHHTERGPVWSSPSLGIICALHSAACAARMRHCIALYARNGEKEDGYQCPEAERSADKLPVRVHGCQNSMPVMYMRVDRVNPVMAPKLVAKMYSCNVSYTVMTVHFLSSRWLS